MPKTALRHLNNKKTIELYDFRRNQMLAKNFHEYWNAFQINTKNKQNRHKLSVERISTNTLCWNDFRKAKKSNKTKTVES